MPNYISNNTGHEIDNMIDSYLSFRKTIKVLAPENSIIIVEDNTTSPATTLPGFTYSNYTLFFPEKYGSYVVNCSYNGSIISETVYIDTVKIYEVDFNSPGPEPELGYITFSSNAPFSLSVRSDVAPYYEDTYYSAGWDGTLEYSTDKVTWSSWPYTSIQSVQQVYGKYEVYLRGSNNTAFCKYKTDVTPNEWRVTNFVLTASQGELINCFGNIETLLDYQKVLSGISPPKADRTFWMLFRGCTSLATAPKLPSIYTYTSCYERMFEGCTSLVSAPELPATTFVASGGTYTLRCYYAMFYGCTSLITAPALPATALSDECYRQMFEGCTSLVSAPQISATTLALSCCHSMFKDCIALTTASALSATTLAGSCYACMFEGCTSLITAPSLSATTLAVNCYMQMFMGCTSLISIPRLLGGALPANCCENMFRECTSLATMPTSFGVGSAGQRCCSGMFYGCVSLAGTLPTLSANVLPLQCYYQMFYGCESIKLSTTQTGSYTEPYRIPTTLDGTTTGSEVVEYMFTGTGGTFQGTPYINITYFQDIS